MSPSRRPRWALMRIGGAACALSGVMNACAPRIDPPVPPPPLSQSAYSIGRGDTLEVIVWGEEKLSGPVTVRPDGQMTMPLIGDVAAAGHAPDVVATEIRQRLEHYVDAPNVVVRVVATGSRRFFVIGNVRAPGAYDMTANQTLLQALAMAGGLNEFADADDLSIVRSDGQPRLTPDYEAIIRGERPDVGLEPDDTIVVP